MAKFKRGDVVSPVRSFLRGEHWFGGGFTAVTGNMIGRVVEVSSKHVGVKFSGIRDVISFSCHNVALAGDQLAIDWKARDV